jgi:hypothetical protein
MRKVPKLRRIHLIVTEETTPRIHKGQDKFGFPLVRVDIFTKFRTVHRVLGTECPESEAKLALESSLL